MFIVIYNAKYEFLQNGIAVSTEMTFVEIINFNIRKFDIVFSCPIK